jgi:hypothetical protein
MPSPWRDCPDSERAKVHEINLAIGDMANPCELAEILAVPIDHLWARQVASGGGVMLNDFYLPLNKEVVRRIAAGKKKTARPKAGKRKIARPKTRKRRSSK